METVHVHDMSRIVVGVDPPGSVNTECGIVVVGLLHNGMACVLDDKSLLGTPAQWARAVVNAYTEWRADRIIGEKNYGGDMVENTIRSVDGGQNVAYKSVVATRGKKRRAEPISALYEKGLVYHAGVFSALEDEMCSWTEDENWSPNRLDALVWALTELMVGPQYGPPTASRYA